MNELNLVKMESEIIGGLVKAGIPEDEARHLASKHIDTMGITKIIRGDCPRGALSPIACTFCTFGHMTECHYPYTCKESECSHYLTCDLE